MWCGINTRFLDIENRLDRTLLGAAAGTVGNGNIGGFQLGQFRASVAQGLLALFRFRREELDAEGRCVFFLGLHYQDVYRLLLYCLVISEVSITPNAFAVDLRLNQVALVSGSFRDQAQ